MAKETAGKREEEETCCQDCLKFCDASAA